MVVGLGSGSLACRSRAGERWTYFEIDPAVIEIARDRSKFRMLSECAPTASIVLGDARLTLAEATEPADLIVLDAFSSDVVPVHLLTREALDLYLGKLAPNGVLVFHISNRYLELSSVVATLAAERGLVTYVRRDQSVTREDFRRTCMRARWSRWWRATRPTSPASPRTGEWKKQTADRRCAPGPTISPTCSPPCGGWLERNSSIAPEADSRGGNFARACARPLCPQLRQARHDIA